METNLLPENLKTELKNRNKIRKFMFLTFIFAFCVLVFSLVIISFEKVTGDEEEMMQNQLTNAKLLPANTELIKKQNQLDKMQTLADDLSEVQKDQLYISSFVASIYSAIPDNTRLESVSMNFTESKITIKGNSLSRDKLLSFIDNLKNLPSVSRVENPLSNLVAQSNINFEIEIIPNQAEIKKLSNEKTDK